MGRPLGLKAYVIEHLFPRVVENNVSRRRLAVVQNDLPEHYFHRCRVCFLNRRNAPAVLVGIVNSQFQRVG